MTSQEIIDWVTHAARAKHQGDAIARITIAHLKPTAEEVVYEHEFDKETDVPEAAKFIDERLRGDAKGLASPTVQRYRLRAFYGAQEMARDTKTATLNAHLGEPQAADSEPANQQGLVAQSMRHTEVSVKIGLGATADVLDHYREIMRAQAHRIDELEGTHLETLRLMEELQSQKHLRELATDQAVLEEKRKDELFSKIMVMIPTLVNKVAGAPMLPAAQNPETEIVKSLLGTLRPEQLQSLGAVLDPAQMMAVLQLWEVARAQAQAAAQGAPQKAA